MPVTIEQLKKCMPTLPHLRAVGLLPHLNKALVEFEIDSTERLAAFLAQVGHETLDLRHMQELWGPTEQQRKYEPPSELATKLGNILPGDSSRYRGRGAIQLTGRHNYQRAGAALKLRLEEEPRLAASADHAFRIAGWYWRTKNLNECIDAGDFDEVTRRINGGFNGKADRDERFARALKVLAASDIG